MRVLNKLGSAHIISTGHTAVQNCRGYSTKTGTTPAIVTAPATDLKGGPAIEDFADGDIEVQEITMDAHRADAPSGPV